MALSTPPFFMKRVGMSFFILGYTPLANFTEIGKLKRVLGRGCVQTAQF